MRGTEIRFTMRRGSCWGCRNYFSNLQVDNGQSNTALKKNSEMLCLRLKYYTVLPSVADVLILDF